MNRCLYLSVVVSGNSLCYYTYITSPRSWLAKYLLDTACGGVLCPSQVMLKVLIILTSNFLVPCFPHCQIHLLHLKWALTQLKLHREHKVCLLPWIYLCARGQRVLFVRQACWPVVWNDRRGMLSFNHVCNSHSPLWTHRALWETWCCSYSCGLLTGLLRNETTCEIAQWQ
jgi:hypothetical protein